MNDSGEQLDLNSRGGFLPMIGLGSGRYPVYGVVWAALILVLSACAKPTHANQQAQGMLDEIIASGKPQGFDKINVSDTVAGNFPVGTRKIAVIQAFKGLKGVLIYDDAPGTLLVRYDKGKAMFDVDPRTVLAAFSFDSNGMLVSVRAVHVKNQ